MRPTLNSFRGSLLRLFHKLRTESRKSFVTTCVSRQRRVVVTGLGVVSPLGVGIDRNWKRLISGETGITAVHGEGYDDIPCKVAAYVPARDLDLPSHFTKSEIRTLSLSTLYALMAAEEALKTANWLPSTDEEMKETGVAVGCGMCDINDIVENGVALKDKGYRKVNPHFVTRILVNMPAGNISIKYRLKGPNHAVSTACATGLHAIGDGFNFVRNGNANVMLCGGTEAAITPLSIASFCRIRALCCNFNEKPEEASRPFDELRSGFVMGEGCGLLVLEELNHALKRNAKIFAEILGYGLSGDAHHITAPEENGEGAKMCMEAALKNARIPLTEVTHINCHATSTPLGDAAEVSAIKSLFGSHYKNVAITSCKGQIGHLLGAAGSVEALFTVLSCLNSKIPPTVNLDRCLDNSVKISRHTKDWEKASVRNIAVKNSFGFGGTNASLVLSSFNS